MVLEFQAEAPPLRQDDSGAIRVGDSRVLLDMVVHAFEDGATPEDIVSSYPTLSLADVYAVIAYLLRHPADVHAYLAERERQAADVRQRIEAYQADLPDMRARLLARRAERLSHADPPAC